MGNGEVIALLRLPDHAPPNVVGVKARRQRPEKGPPPVAGGGQGEGRGSPASLLRATSPDRDPPGLRLLRLRQCQRQNAILELCADLLLVDLVRQREGPRIVAHV